MISPTPTIRKENAQNNMRLKTKSIMPSNRMYWNVPTWAPTKGKYRELSTPICRWMTELIEGRSQQMELFDDIALRNSLDSDVEMMNLCLLVNILRQVNWILCDNKIITSDGVTYDDTGWNNTLQNRFETVKVLRNNDMNKPIERLTVWKRDMKVSKYCTLIIALSNRLRSFHDKRNKINFNSPPMIEYNISISQMRIELNNICCLFLDKYLPKLNSK